MAGEEIDRSVGSLTAGLDDFLNIEDVDRGINPDDPPVEDKPKDEPPKPKEEKGDPQALPAEPDKPDEDSPTDLDLPDDLLGEDPSPQGDESVADEELDTVESGISDEKVREAFKRLRRDAHEAKVKLKEVQSKPVEDTAEVVQLREQLAELDSQLGKINLAESPAFKKKYEIPYQEIIRDAVEDAEAEGAGREIIASAMRAKSLQERKQILRDAIDDPMAASTIYQRLREADKLNMARADELEAWRENKAKYESQQSQKAIIMQQDMAQEAFEAARARAVQEKFRPAMKIEGNEAWNKHVEMLDQQAYDVFTSDKLEEQAYLMYLGTRAVPLLNAYVKERQRAADALRQLEKITGSSSRMDSSSPDPTTTASEVPDELTPDEAGKRALESLR